MKRLLFFIAMLVLCVETTTGPVKARETELINRAWKYAQGDLTGAERTDYNDDGWQKVGLPHSFSIPYFMSKDFYTGYGWYRKRLDFTAQDLKKRIFLEFDGVFQDCEVFVNGTPAGRHTGGYTGFTIDITKALHKGANLLAVRVNNLWRPDVAPRAGEHVFSGGIYRNVRLVKVNPVHVAWCGTFVTTPELESTQGRSSSVRIATEIENAAPSTANYRLITQIVSPSGKVVATASGSISVPGKSRKAFVQRTTPVDNPVLWCHDNPAMYKAVSSIFKGPELVDRYETPFGFRWFKWTADKGFFLNGRHVYIKGANVHQDQAGWGDAVTDSAAARDVRMMRDAGFDFIRGSHYPHAPAFVGACDENGMMFWSEAPFWGIGGFGPDGYWNASAYPVNPKDRAGFEKSALQQLGEMIRIHRNHPSIVAWSMCNEAFFSASNVMGGVKDLLGKMVKLSHELDPSRPAAVGGAQRPLGDARIDRIGDVAGYNGDGATQPDFQQPGVASIVSEYGSNTAERPGEYAAGWGDLAKDDGWRGKPWRAGQAIWCGFDHGSIAGEALGKMGIVDYFRIPKRSWYWYRNAYRGIRPPEWPVQGVAKKLGITASKTSGIATDGTDDAHLTVTVCDVNGKPLSNTPDVTLRIVSGPGEFPTGRSITFSRDSDIPILDGQAAITLRSYYAGRCVVEATSNGLESARIELNFIGPDRYMEGVSPLTEIRPYHKFVRKVNDTRSVITLGVNNPTFASSSAAGHPAGMAADGKADTWWQARTDDASPYLILDIEKVLDVKAISILFPSAGAYPYKLEVSTDKTNWKTVTDSRQAGSPTAGKAIIKDAGKARFFRISFSDNRHSLPAAIAEICVTGILP